MRFWESGLPHCDGLLCGGKGDFSGWFAESWVGSFGGRERLRSETGSEAIM